MLDNIRFFLFGTYIKVFFLTIFLIVMEYNQDIPALNAYLSDFNIYLLIKF